MSSSQASSVATPTPTTATTTSHQQAAPPAYDITLYTAPHCPNAHRVHLALDAAGLAYKEHFIDLDKPREEWYLRDIHPHGQVPALKIGSVLGPDPHILIGPQIITQFLADLVPHRLQPPSTTALGAILRARTNYFIDTWTSKINHFMFQVFRAKSDGEKEKLSIAWVQAVQQEIEPLLEGINPYFFGSKKLTLVEVNIAPFVIRIYALAAANVIPGCIIDRLDSLPNFGRWAQAIRQDEVVLKVWKEKDFVERTIDCLEKRLKQCQGGGSNNHSNNNTSIENCSNATIDKTC